MLGDFIKSHMLAITVAGLLLIGFAGFSVYMVASRAGKEPVEVLLVPSDTKLTVNGAQLHPGTAYLAPGQYEVVASRGGFKTETKKITITRQNTLTIDLALDPVSSAAVKWAKDNQQLYLDAEGRQGVRKSQEGETFSKLNPITSVIPYKNLIYTIGYRSDKSDPSGNSIIIEIDAMSGYRNAAVNKIRDLGYDPTRFKIQFRDYESPFDHE